MKMVNAQGKKWEPEIVSMLKTGWLGIGFTVINSNNARKRMVGMTDSIADQQALESWVADRVVEGYVPAFRYYVAKTPCKMQDSEFVGPILLRHQAFGYEVIVEAILQFEDADANGQLLAKLKRLINHIHVKEVCEEFALHTDMKSYGAKVVYGNNSGITPESALPSHPGPVIIRRVGPKFGRNEPCPCGSGIKSKKCHCGGRIN